MISNVNASPAFGNSSKWAMAARKNMQSGANNLQAIRRTAQTTGAQTAQHASILGQAQVLLQQAKTTTAPHS